MNGAIVRAYSLAKDGKNLKLAPNFTLKEFACKDGSDVVFVWVGMPDMLQQARYHFKARVILNSFYRTPAYNKKIGGSTYSRHLFGMAADVVVEGVPPLEVARYFDKFLGDKGCVGLYKNYVHVDGREKKYRYDKRSGKEVAVSGF